MDDERGLLNANANNLRTLQIRNDVMWSRLLFCFSLVLFPWKAAALKWGIFKITNFLPKIRYRADISLLFYVSRSLFVVTRMQLDGLHTQPGVIIPFRSVNKPWQVIDLFPNNSWRIWKGAGRNYDPPPSPNNWVKDDLPLSEFQESRSSHKTKLFNICGMRLDSR